MNALRVGCIDSRPAHDLLKGYEAYSCSAPDPFARTRSQDHAHDSPDGVGCLHDAFGNGSWPLRDC